MFLILYSLKHSIKLVVASKPKVSRRISFLITVLNGSTDGTETPFMSLPKNKVFFLMSLLSKAKVNNDSVLEITQINVSSKEQQVILFIKLFVEFNFNINLQLVSETLNGQFNHTLN